MAPHSSALAWKIPWTEEPGGLQSMGSLRVGHDWATSLSLFIFMHWRRKWQPTPVFLPGEFQGRGSLVGCRLWGRTESDTIEATYQQQQVLLLEGILLSLHLPEAYLKSNSRLKAESFTRKCWAPPVTVRDGSLWNYWHTGQCSRHLLYFWHQHPTSLLLVQIISFWKTIPFQVLAHAVSIKLVLSLVLT